MYLCFFSNLLFAQETYTISGIIKEKSSGETLIGVAITFPDILKGTSSNEYGFYSFTLPEGTYNMEISYLGFRTISKKIVLKANKHLKNKTKEKQFR